MIEFKPNAMPDPAVQAPPLPSQYVRLILRGIGIRDADFGRFLDGTDIDAEAFRAGEMLVGIPQLEQITLNVIAHSGERAPGLRMGRLLTPAAYGEVGFLVSSSPDLGTALRHFVTFVPVKVPFAHLESTDCGDAITCEVRMLYYRHPDVIRTCTESIAVSLLGIVRAIAGYALDGMHLEFGYAAPDYAARYDALEIPVSFGHAATRLWIPKALLPVRNPIASIGNYEQAVRQCESIARTRPAGAMATRVRELLLAMPAGMVTTAVAARSLFTSVRTLTRQLAREGTSFREIRESVIGEIAMQHLRETRASVEYIAAMLGYHDTANFRRAFRKWFGRTPGAFRRDPADDTH